MPGVRETIAGHLLSAWPNEGCGVLVGDVTAGGVKRVYEAVGMANVEPARGRDRYQLDPRANMKLEVRLRDRKYSYASLILGFFHSHPDGVAQPSAIDLEMAQGLFEFTHIFYIYAIQAVSKDAAGEFTFWRLSQERESFTRLEIQ